MIDIELKKYTQGIDELLKEKHSLDTVLKIFRLAFDEAAVPIMISTDKGDVLLVNKKTLQETGYTFEEVNTVSKWTEKVHRDRRQYNDEFIKNNFEKGVRLQGQEEYVYTKDEKVLIWAFHVAILGELPDGRKVSIVVSTDVTKERQIQRQLNESINRLENTQAFLHSAIESQNEFIILMLDKDFNYLFCNQKHKENMLSMYNNQPTMGDNIFDYITIESDKVKERERYNRALNGESFSIVDRYGEKNDLFFETFYSPIKNNSDEVIGISVFTSNITKKIEELNRVQESEMKFRQIYSSMSQGLAVHEIIIDENKKPIDYRYVEVNESYLRLFNYKRQDIIGKRILEVVPELESYWIEVFGSVALTGEPKYFENYSKSSGKFLSTYAYSPKRGQFAVLISDITERIKKEKEIKYLSYNDQLTKVYNRRYYEEKLQELDQEEYYPLSLILGDVNGLKLVNDSFGHQVGDKLLVKVSDILSKACRTKDIITRIGGDEFVIILPNTTNEQAKNVIERINILTENEQINAIDVSISFGYGTKVDNTISMDSLFKQIEDDMYRNKLNDSKSMRSKTIDLIMTTLYEKNEREMFHSKRVGAYCEKFAKKLHLDNEQINEVRNAGLMHDIGKIGVDEQILNKTGQLTEKEFIEVRKHSEIGYRILNSVNEFGDIANFILEHHERMDGKGYPYGLTKDQISLQGRIINIVDSYDAMTGPRPYKKSLTKEEAINELIEGSGTQFDSDLVQVFINEVLED